jgi:hypothetical protein
MPPAKPAGIEGFLRREKNPSKRRIFSPQNGRDAVLAKIRDERNLLAKYGCPTEENQRVIQTTMDAMLSALEAGKKKARRSRRTGRAYGEEHD